MKTTKNNSGQLYQNRNRDYYDRYERNRNASQGQYGRRNYETPNDYEQNWNDEDYRTESRIYSRGRDNTYRDSLASYQNEGGNYPGGSHHDYDDYSANHGQEERGYPEGSEHTGSNDYRGNDYNYDISYSGRNRESGYDHNRNLEGYGTREFNHGYPQYETGRDYENRHMRNYDNASRNGDGGSDRPGSFYSRNKSRYRRTENEHHPYSSGEWRSNQH